MLAARRAALFAYECGIQQSSFEEDSEFVIKSLRNGERPHSSVGHILKDTLSYHNLGDNLKQLSSHTSLLQDLFHAGIVTMSGTMEWAMAMLLQNPEKMTKAQVELEEVLGKARRIQELDISKFLYLQAIGKETLRFHPSAPILLPRKAMIDVEKCGFIVPKNAQILINVWAMGRDFSTWPNSNLFMPERFLEHAIEFKGQDFELITFGAGRRKCPGLPLANRMVPLILASLIHQFVWKLPDEMKPEDLDLGEMFGLTLRKAESLLAIPIRSL
ncbi:cytochrome P450 76C4-like [Castanea sativa]|uniref:cytochrome P450 76C4-like n=1 Tax=Castanea sativa TaxID=21020 RepID=UPI003F64AB97